MSTLALLAVIFASSGTCFLQEPRTNINAPVQSPGIVDLPVVPDGASRVWFEPKQEIYICKGEPHFGKTRRGEFMRETEAKKRGARPKNGVGCPSR